MGFYYKKILKIFELIYVKFADIVVVDNIVIKNYVSDEYGIDSVFIPYGGDHCNMIKPSNFMLDQYPFLNGEYAFKVCRIEQRIILKSFLRLFSIIS